MPLNSRNAKLELRSPIDDSLLMELTTATRSTAINRRPVFANKGYHASAAVTARRIRAVGTVSIQKNADSLALAREVERWQKGIRFYPLTSDLKGRRYHLPTLRITMTNDDGSVEVVTAYGIKLTDNNLDMPVGPAKETFTFEVLSGFDNPAVESWDPLRALDFHRTGFVTYVDLNGQFRAAGDGVARFGVPRPVVRRNKLAWSTDLTRFPWETVGITVIKNAAKAPDGTVTAHKLILNSGAGDDHTNPLTQGVGYSDGHTWSIFAKAAGRTKFSIQDGQGNLGYFDLGTGLTLSWGEFTPTAVMTPVGDGWYLCEVRFPAGGNGGVWYQYFSGGGPGNGTDGILFWMPQVEVGGVATTRQPTNSTGPDYSHPMLGGGLVLEGEGANLVPNTNGRPNSMVATGTVPPIVELVSFDTPFGSQAWKITFPAGTPAGYGGGMAVSDTWFFTHNGPYSYSVWISGDLTGLAAYHTGANAFYGARTGRRIGGFSEIGGPWKVDGGPVAGQAALHIFPDSPLSADRVIYVAASQVEDGAFSTSLMLGPVAPVRRQPDHVGIVHPHNLIPWSTDFSRWAKSGVTIVNQTAQDPQRTNTAAVLQKAAVASPAIWIDSGVACAGKTVTFPIWLAAGSLSKTQIRIMDDSQTIGSDLKTVDLVPEWRRYDVTYTFPLGVTGNAQVLLYIDHVNATPGTIYAWHPNLHLGSMPGMDVPTTDTPILPPPSPALDPAWSQNGRARFRVFPPPASTGGSYSLLGENWNQIGGPKLGLWRFGGTPASANTLYYERRHNASTGTGGNAGQGQINGTPFAFYDGAAHDVILEWTNYEAYDPLIGNVRRYMWQRLYVDGKLVAEQDVAALYGATKWAEIDHSRLISDGNVHAVLSMQPNGGGVIIEFPTLPAGAIPAAA